MASSPEEQLATMLANIPEKTGKPLAAWLKIIASSGLSKHGQIVKLLKTEHGMTHGFANLVANRALGGGEASGSDLIEAQYAGPKAELRPIYEAIAKFVQTLGKDVELAPKKTCVSLRRSKQFALVQASTKTRVDLGIKFKDQQPVGRLEAAGSFNAMVSHRVRLTSIADVDDDVKAWLKQAYEQA
jgi:predicted transport protein